MVWSGTAGMPDGMTRWPQSKMTEDELAEYISKRWKMFKVRVKTPLKEVFPEPQCPGLKHIWRYGHADVFVSNSQGRPLAVIEPGGTQHFEKKQARNDRLKYKLCEINGVKCLHFLTGLESRLSKRKFRNLIRKFLMAN